MASQIQAALVHLGNSRQAIWLLGLLLLTLTLAGCGDIVPACPAGASSGSCGGG